MRTAVVTRTALAILGSVALLACSGPAKKSTETPEIEIDDSAEPVPTGPVEIPRVRTGAIARARMLEVLDQGVGRFLTQFEVEAHVVEGRFGGWTILRSDNQWIDLLPGDVVTAVNGRRIETPAQVQALWMNLRGADAIEVSALRSGQAFELRFTVQGQVEATTP